MIEKILCEWTLMMESCALTLYADNEIVGCLMVRPDTSVGQQEPSGWQHRLAPLDDSHKKEVSPDQVRQILPKASVLRWECARAVLGMIELNGKGDGLWLSFNKAGTPEEITSAAADLAKIRDFLLGQ